eukprot:gene35746-43361_t
MAFTFHHRWHYAGAYNYDSLNHEHPHHVDTAGGFDFFFGNRSSVDGSHVLSHNASSGAEKVKIISMASFSSLHEMSVNLSLLLPVNNDRTILIYRPDEFKESKQTQKLRVAVHIRLGDVWERDEIGLRLTNLIWYSSIIQEIQFLYPDSQFHVFSSFLGHLHYSKHPAEVLHEAFSSFENVSVHLDNEGA